MTRIEVLCLLLATFCLIELTIAAPAQSEGNDVVDEIIAKLRFLKLQAEGNIKLSVFEFQIIIFVKGNKSW
jgi:hypothetical protein